MTPTVNEAAFVASTDGRSLYVPPGTLKAGVDYTFEFSVSDGSRGYARQVEYCHGALAISFWRPIVTRHFIALLAGGESESSSKRGWFVLDHQSAATV